MVVFSIRREGSSCGEVGDAHVNRRKLEWIECLEEEPEADEIKIWD